MDTDTENHLPLGVRRPGEVWRPALLVGFMLSAGLFGGGYAYGAAPEKSSGTRIALASDILGVAPSRAPLGSSIPTGQVIDPDARLLMAGGGGGGNGGDRGGDKPKKKPKKPEKTEKQKKKDWFDEFKDAVREDFGDNRGKKK